MGTYSNTFYKNAELINIDASKFFVTKRYVTANRILAGVKSFTGRTLKFDILVEMFISDVSFESPLRTENRTANEANEAFIRLKKTSTNHFIQGQPCNENCSENNSHFSFFTYYEKRIDLE